MAERGSPGDGLTAILQQLRLQQANGTSPSEVTHRQVELLLARIASLTRSLRQPGEGGETRAAMRLLLADVAMVAAQFRGNTNALDERLSRALDDARVALERSTDKPLNLT